MRHCKRRLGPRRPCLYFLATRRMLWIQVTPDGRPYIRQLLLHVVLRRYHKVCIDIFCHVSNSNAIVSAATKALQFLSLGELQDSVDHLERLAHLVQASKVTVDDNHGGLKEFADVISSCKNPSTQLATALSGMWKSHNVRTQLVEVAELNIHLQHQQLMLANAIAWVWLVRDCQRALHELIASIQQERSALQNATDWFPRLVRDVYLAMDRQQAMQFFSDSYLSSLPRADFCLSVPIERTRQSKIAERVTQSVLRCVREWLGFPSNTEMLAAFFVCYLLRAVDNPDVLLLPTVWVLHRDIKSKILLASKGRHSSLTISLLDPLAEVLSSLPITDNTSAEAKLLQRLSNTISASFPHLRALRQTVRATVQPHIVRRLEVDKIPLSPATQKGLQTLLEFVRELLPLLDDPRPAKLTEMQMLVASKPNFYLPFRECAPHRRHATGPHGPFHPSRCDEPGALPSAAIFRGMLFGAPILDDDSTTIYFRTYEDWCSLVSKFNHLNTAQLHHHFFDIHAYGTAQGHKPSTFTDNMQAYFDCESQWLDLVAEFSPRPIPFKTCYNWTQRMQRTPDDSSTTKRRALPLHGGLTGYLLTADLSYTHNVQAPTLSDIAGVIHQNGMGSLRGLIRSEQIGRKASKADVLEGFSRVYEFLDNALTVEEKKLMVFDPIMVEHLLCKLERVLSHLKKPSVRM